MNKPPRLLHILKLVIMSGFIFSLTYAEESGLDSLKAKRSELLSELQKIDSQIKKATFQKRESSSTNKEELSGLLKVISVADGDTLTVLTSSYDKIKIRFQGIDAPELGQEYGQKAKDDLKAITRASGGQVAIEDLGKDQYGRTLARVYDSKGGNVGLQLVENGSAWHFEKYSDDVKLAQAQIEAKANKRGLWGADVAPISPDEYRAGKKRLSFIKKQETKSEPDGEVDAKRFWINDSSSHKRHNKGCRWYGNTKRGHYSSDPNEGSTCGICGG